MRGDGWLIEREKEMAEREERRVTARQWFNGGWRGWSTTSVGLWVEEGEGEEKNKKSDCNEERKRGGKCENFLLYWMT